MTDMIRTGREGAVATITIDRPGEGNMLTLDMLRALAAAFRAAGASDAKVILLALGRRGVLPRARGQGSAVADRHGDAPERHRADPQRL